MSGRVVDLGEQPPAAILTYALDLTDWIAALPAGDTIASASVLTVSPPDLTVSAPDISAPPLVAFTASLGTHGSRYSIAIKVQSVAGSADEFVALIAVIDPAVEVASVVGPGVAA